MRRIISLILFSCFTVSLLAQVGIKVNNNGSKPTVTDFIWAALPSLNFEDEEETGDRPWLAMKSAMEHYRKGLPQEEGDTLIIDSRNGYALYEQSREEDPDYIFRLEVCFWNESDGKHKLICFNNMASVMEGKPCITETSYVNFYRYDNATKRMVACDPPGFEIQFDGI